MNEQLLLSLIEIGSKAFEAIQRIRAEDPAAYAAVEQHVGDALERAKAAAQS